MAPVRVSSLRRRNSWQSAKATAGRILERGSSLEAYQSAPVQFSKRTLVAGDISDDLLDVGGPSECDFALTLRPVRGAQPVAPSGVVPVSLG